MHDITARKQSEDLLRIQHDLAIKLSRTVVFDEGLKIILESALKASNMDGGAIYLFDEETKDLNIVLHKGFSDDFINSVSRYENNSPNTRLLMKGQPIYVKHEDLELNVSHSEKKENLKAVAIIPIKFQNQIFGCLNVASKSKEKIPISTRMILETITNQIGQSFLHLKTQTDFKKSEERYQDLYNNAPDMYVSVCAKTATILECNHTISNELGYSREELIGRSVFSLYMPDSAKYAKNIAFPQFLKTGAVTVEEMQLKRKNGSPLYVSLNATAVRDGKGNIIRSRSIWRDITQQIKLKQRLLQAQKVESIGKLAGGIAHDFNNILSPIIGMSELLLEDLPPRSLEYENAEEICRAGRRGSELVKQILAFSRQSERMMVPTHIQNILREVMKLCRSTIPVNIELNQDIQMDCGMVLADPTQIHQVAMNIIANAYHAVKLKGGMISVRLAETVMDSFSMKTDLEPGKYAVFSVSDTGHGISPDIIDKIFDPYFTTKGMGEGTGLGLSVVYGIIQDHKGAVFVNSEIGKGTTFEFYFPLYRQSGQTEIKQEVKSSPTGNERILLVDDEQAVLKLEQQILERLGYQITSKLSSIEALEAFKSDPGSFDLVISDVTMPKMTGDELARELISIRPDIPIILCTGFSQRIDEEKAHAIGVRGFLMKPIAISKIANIIRRIFDESENS